MTKIKGKRPTPLRYSMQVQKLKRKVNFLLKITGLTHVNFFLKAKDKGIQYQEVKEVGTVKGYTSTVDDSNKV